MAKKRASDALLREIRAYGLALPGAHTKSPWPGHLDLAVNDKTFAYLSLEGEPLSVGCKLPHSAQLALELPFCTPMPYGLGKSGWVSASFPDDKQLPSFEMLVEWIDESYRAQAPRKLLKELDARTTGHDQVAPPRPRRVRSTDVRSTAARGSNASAGRSAGRGARRSAGRSTRRTTAR